MIAAVFQVWPAALAVALFGVAAAGAWIRGVYRAGHAVGVFDIAARQLGLVRCDSQIAVERQLISKTQIGAESNGEQASLENGAQVGRESA